MRLFAKISQKLRSRSKVAGLSPRQKVLGLGTGRCGFKFIAKIVHQHKNAIGYNERAPFFEAYYRYCDWNGLPVDHEGFFQFIRDTLDEDLKRVDVSYWSSPWFAGKNTNILRAVAPQMVTFLYRDPEQTVESFFRKEWYLDTVLRADHCLAAGLQPELWSVPHRSFSRVIPRGEEYESWNHLTRLGKIAWYWNSMTEAILNLLVSLPRDRVIPIHLESSIGNFKFYEELSHRLELKPQLSRKQFLALSADSNENPSKKELSWSTQERKEFNSITNTTIERLNNFLCHKGSPTSATISKK